MSWENPNIECIEEVQTGYDCYTMNNATKFQIRLHVRVIHIQTDSIRNKRY